jgi:ABC-type oligopeptide transport system substrate-binding subunit
MESTMKKLLIAAAVLAVSGAAFAGSGTVSSSTSSSGGSTMAGVAGFGHFSATDSGSALGAAGAIAGGPGSGSISYTNHTQTSTV